VVEIEESGDIVLGRWSNGDFVLSAHTESALAELALASWPIQGRKRPVRPA
jgi:hypothetical protein